MHIEVREEFATFAIFYIMAQAVERLVEPLMNTRAMKSDEAERAKAGVRAATSSSSFSTGDDAGAVLTPQERLDRIKAQRAIIAWAAASAVALLGCGILGLGLIESVAHVEGGAAWWHGVDVVVTGLAVGAGTKPLHDLIKRFEKAKDKAGD